MEYKMKRLAIALTVTLSALLNPPLLFAQENLFPDYLERLTTVPEDDTNPVLSPDGRWLVFVSNATGQGDLIRLDLNDPLRFARTTLFPHPTRDSSPAFSPDGSVLVWLSQRSDIFGDLWVARFPDGEPQNLGKRVMQEQLYSWKKNNDQLDIQFRTSGRNIEPTIEKVNLTSLLGLRKNTVPLVPAGEYALQYFDDTNGDGILETGGDYPSLWQMNGTNLVRQLTPPLPGLQDVTVAEKEIAFSLLVENNRDIYRLKHTFPLGFSSLQSSIKRLDEVREPSLKDLYLFTAQVRNACIEKPESEETRSGFLALLEFLRSRNRSVQGLRELKEFVPFLQASASSEFSNQLNRWQAVLEADSASKLPESPERTTALNQSLAALDALLQIAQTEGNREEGLVINRERALILLALNQRQASLQLQQTLLSEIPDPSLLHSRVLLDSIRLLLQIDSDQAISQFQGLLDLDQVYLPSPRFQLLEELYNAITINEPNTDAKLTAIRRFRSRDISPYFLLHSYYREAQLLAKAGDTSTVRSSLDGILFNPALDMDYQSQLQLAAGRIETQIGDYESALSRYQKILTTVPLEEWENNRGVYEQTREEYLRQSLSQANTALRLGDNRLAYGQFNAITESLPDSVEGWRGLIEAENRTGLLTPDRIAEYQKLSKANDPSGLALYRYGLALSYPKPESKKTKSLIEKAISANSSVSYYYQTLGFLNETRGRSKGDVQEYVLALGNYQRALGLVSLENRPLDYSRLLQNAGNMAFALDNTARAFEFYSERDSLGFPFDDPRAAFLFHRNFGVVAYRSYEQDLAIREFDLALAQLTIMERQKLISKEQATALVLELTDRKALAELSRQNFDASSTLFASVAKGSEVNSLSRARALRNQGYALFQQARNVRSAERYTIAENAISVLEQSLDLLKQKNLSVPKEDSKGLFSLSLQLSSSDQSTAQVNLSQEDERRFVTLILSRLKAEFESPADARASLENQLNMLQQTRNTAAPQDSLALLQTLDELATLERRTDPTSLKPLSYLVEGFQNANYQSDAGTVLLLDPSYHFLMRICEVGLAFSDQELAPFEHDFFSDQSSQSSFLVQLDKAIFHFLDSTPFQTATTQGAMHAELVSLTLQRALIAERLSLQDDSWESVGNAVRASLLVDRAIALGMEPSASAREKRWLVLAYGLKVRLANRFQSQQDETIAEAELFYNQQGFDDWLWWLKLQQITSTQASEERITLQKSLVDLLDSTTATNDSPAFIACFSGIEKAVTDYMTSCVLEGNTDEMLRAGEVLRHAEYRLQFSPLDWQSSSVTPQELEWFTDWNQYRRQVIQARLALQSRTTDNAYTQPRAERLLRAKELLSAHLKSGVNSAFPSALRFAPFEFTGDAASTLKDFILSEQRLCLIVSLPNLTVLFDGSGEAKTFTSEEELVAQIPSGALVFHSDYRPFGSPKLGIESAIQSPSLSLTLLALSQTPLRISQDVAEWTATTTREELLQRLPSSDQVAVQVPLNLEADAYSFWRLGGKPFETQLPLLEFSREWNFANVAGDPRPFVALMATASAARIETPSNVWLAELMNPEDVPDSAASELDAELARVIRLLNQGQTREAIGPLRRVYLLRRALQLPIFDQVEAGKLLAQSYRELGQAKDALPVHEQLLDLLQGDEWNQERAVQLRLYASDANEVRSWEKSATAYQEASNLFASLGDTEESLTMLRRAAIVRENQGQLNQSLELMSTLLENPSATEALRQQLHSDRGRIYLRRLNLYDKAITEYQEAERLATSIGDRNLELLAALDVVRSSERLGMISQATDQAKLILEQAQAENLPERECDALLTLCYLEWTKGQYLNAFNYQERGAQIAQRINDQLFQLIALNYQGLIYWSLNDLDKSLAAYTQAITLAEAQFFELDVSSTLNNRSLVYRSAKDYTKALADLSRAFEIDARWNNDWALAYNLRNRGLTYLESGELNLAEQDFRKALKLTQSIGDSVNEAKVTLALARSLLLQNQRTEAKAFFEQAIVRANAVPLPEVKWQALYGLSKCAKSLGDTDQQVVYLVQAIEIVDSLRASLKLAEFQDGFLADKQVLYDDLLLLRMDQGDWVAAYKVSEQARGRNFIDLLGNQKVDLLDGADEEDLRREENLRSRKEILERQLSSDDPTLVERVTQQLTTTRQEYSDFLLALRARNPELTEFISVEPMGVKDVQALLDPETAVVQYHVTENELVIFLISQQEIKAFREPLLRSTLRTQILNIRERLQNASNLDVLQTTLSSNLVQPIATSLSPFKRLAIIPHRELHLTPFGVLKWNNALLLETHALYYSPSGSVLRYTMSKERSQSNRVLAIGNPKLNSEAFNLPLAEKEARRMLWSFPEAKVLTGEQATKTWLVENIQNYGIIHLAMHGEFRPEAPLLSGLQLAPDANNNGVLTAADVFGLRLNADMVALSACQTGLGRITEGDEIIGLNRSFVYAGTRQVLSSLWRVDDVSTSVLIKHFYRNLATMNRAEALRQAQMTTRQQYPHPTYWAGITLSGDWK